MRIYSFSKRNALEILRDPTNMFFGLFFSIILLILFTIINNAIPPEANNTMFEIEQIAPGVAMFGTGFMALFSGMLLAKDRTSSFLMRLYTSPMRPIDFIMGYTLPMIIFSIIQSILTFVAATILGLPLSINTLLAVIVLIPISIMFVGIGLFCGSVLDDKAVGGICGALLTNITGWLSGAWIPLDLIGGWFEAIAKALPFYHAVEASRYALLGEYNEIFPHLLIVIVYAIVIYALSIMVFKRKMNDDND